MNRFDRLLRTRAVTELAPGAGPWRNDIGGAKEAVLLLHGFTGIPAELAKVGEALAEAGIASYCPRYPGHGTDRADFLAAGAEDWLRAAIDAYLELRSRYGTVHVCGHSMGGAIATIVAAAFGPPRLVLLAPAIMISRPGVALSPLLAPILPVIRRGKPAPASDSDPLRQRLHAEYRSDDLVAGAAQLVRVMRAARGQLGRLRSRILVMVGEKDDAVPPKVAEYVERLAIGAASFEKVRLEGAGHIFPFDADSGRACALVRDWFTR